jgi:hypothetical protein
VLAALPLFAQAPVRLQPTAADSAAKAEAARADSLRLAAAADTSGDTVSYTAVRIRFRNDRFSLAEGALLEYKGATLKADSIIYHSDEDIVEAFGAPVIEDPLNPAILGYQMRYNLKNRVGTVYYGASHKDGQTFYGNEVRRQPEGGVYIARADMSTCDEAPTPHYHFYARRMIVRPDAQALSGPIVMNIAEVPVAVLPMMLMPLGKGRRSGLLQPKFGGDQSQGFYLRDLGYYWALSDYHDLKLSANVVEGERGTFDNTSFAGLYQWNKRYVWSGMVGGEAFVPEFQPDRAGGTLTFRNDLNITPDGMQTLKGEGTLVSEAEIIERNALTEEDYSQQTANAKLGYNRRFYSSNASLNVEASQDYNLSQRHINRNIPSASFSASGPLIPVSEDNPDPDAADAWYRSWNWTYGNRFNVNQVIRPTSARSGVGDTNVYMGYADNATLSGKYTAFKYFNLTPSLSGSQLWSAGERSGDSLDPYRSAFEPGGNGVGHYFAAWSTSLSAGTSIYGLAQAGGDPWLGRVTAVRHTLSPVVSLTYAPEIDSNRRMIPAPGFGTPYQAEQKAVGFSLGNDVDLKVVAPGADGGDTAASAQKPQSYKLIAANSSLNYNFARDVRPWSDLSSTVSLYLTRNVALTVSAVHGLYDDFADTAGNTDAPNEATAPILKSWGFGWRKGLELSGGLNSGLRVRDSRGLATDRFENSPWSASLNYNFSFSAARVGTDGDGGAAERFLGLSEIYNVTRTHFATGGLKFNPTREWHMTYDTEFNFTEGEFSRHSFGFERTLHCWRMNFNWTPVGLSSGWNFVIRIIDLPDIKLETQDTRLGNR